jgi:ABC-type protease/lipase transport system fused ATPase/permease subunit
MRFGEGDSLLSFGQRQLFCLARAVLKGSICLVLDEATSNLDLESEKHFLQCSTDAFKGKTLITIAVRLHSHFIRYLQQLLLTFYSSHSFSSTASLVLSTRLRPCCYHGEWEDNRRRQSKSIKIKSQKHIYSNAKCIRSLIQ